MAQSTKARTSYPKHGVRLAFGAPNQTKKEHPQTSNFAGSWRMLRAVFLAEVGWRKAGASEGAQGGGGGSCLLPVLGWLQFGRVFF